MGGCGRAGKEVTNYIIIVWICCCTAIGAGGANAYTYAWSGTASGASNTISITVSNTVNAICTITGVDFAITVTAEGLKNLKVGKTVPQEAKIIFTLTGGSYEGTINTADFTGAINNLPAGLSISTVKRKDNTMVEVSIIGTPTTPTVIPINLNIPNSIPAANISGAATPVASTGDIRITVAKGDQAAPDIGKTDVTTHGGSDGKITGLPANNDLYEYKPIDGTNYISVTTNANGEITGLPAGTYHVRLKETATHNPGNPAAVTIVQPNDIPLYEVDGDIQDETGIKQSDVKVSAVLAGELISGPVTTDANGHFTLHGVPEGTYNLVIEYTDDSGRETTVTQIFEVTGNTNVGTITISKTGGKNTIFEHKLTKDSDVSVSAVGGLDKVYENVSNTVPENGVTTADLASVVAGGFVEVRLEANDVDAVMQAIEINAVENKAKGDGNPNILLFDLSAFKDVYNDASDKDVGNSPDTTTTLKQINNLVEIYIPLTDELMGKKDSIAVYRHHNGIVEEITKTPNGSGEKFEIKGDTLILTVMKFSVYAIAYADASVSTTATVTFNANGGNGTMTAVTITKGSYTLPYCAFSLSNYSFGGWKIGNTGTTYATGSSITVNDDITLYAQWTYNGGGYVPPSTATVSFNANGGSGSKNSETVTLGGTYFLPGTPYTRDGYTFDGWKINNAGNTLSSGAVITISGSITLYAQWIYTGGNTNATNATISFNANGGTGSKSSDTVVVGESYILPSNPFTRNGYTFAGWKVNNSGNTLAPGTSVSVNGSITLYAQWTLINSIITASGGNGKVSVNSTTPATGEQVIVTVKPDAGFELDKLTITDENGKNIAYADNGNGKYTYVQPAGTVTVTAKFKRLPAVNGSDVSSLLNTDDHIAYVQGRGDNMFFPNANMTRAEAAQMFYNLLRNKNIDITIKFPDIADDAWYAQAVNTLASMGIIMGFPDGNFYPNENITRAQFATIVVRFAKISTGSIRFSDVPETHWAYDYINTAANFGWVEGIGNGRFEPERNITRAEAVTIVNRMLRRYPDRAYIDSHQELIRYSDTPETHWAFYEIMEASYAHDYERKPDYSEIWKQIHEKFSITH